MTYKYEMYFNDTWNDISNHVQTNAPISDRLDQTFDSSSFTIPYIKADAFAGIDLSAAFKPWIPVRIHIGDTEVYEFYTSDCTRDIIKKSDPKLYKHEVNLIEVTKILQRITTPDNTVTQPKTRQFAFDYISDNKSDNITVDNTSVQPTFNIINQSDNTSIVDGNTLKANYDGQALITSYFKNYQFNYGWNVWNNNYHTDAELEVTMEVYSNGIKIDEYTWAIPGVGAKLDGKWYDLIRNYIPDTPPVVPFSVVVDLPASVSDQVITVKYFTLGEYDHPSTFDINNSYTTEDEVDVITNLSIGSSPNEQDYKYLSEEIQKVIDSMNIKDDNDSTIQYVLDESTKANTVNVLCPEFTFEASTAWDKLEKYANLVNAVPEIINFNTIRFIYLDEIADLFYDQSLFNEETLAQTLDEYVGYLETNTKNLVEEDVLLNAKVEPYEGGWSTVRTDQQFVDQIKDDNAIFKTRSEIQKVYQVAVKGPAVSITNDTTNKTLYGNLTADELTEWGIPSNEDSNSWWHIGDRVVDESRWSVYENSTANKTDITRRSTNTRGNHIYFSQGSRGIKGLGFKTPTVSDIIGSTEAPRALMETVLSTCAVYLDNEPAYTGYHTVDATNTDPEKAIVGDHSIYDDIRYRIYYVALNNSRSRIYRHNAFELGVGANLGNFINEQDRLNDTNSMSRYIKTTLNRQGNVQYSVSGRTDNYDLIPKLGYRTYNDLVVTGRDIQLNKNLVMYDLHLSKDFINRSTFLGRESAFRSFEIPSSDVVTRQDIYNEFIVLTKNKEDVLASDYSILTPYGKQMFIQNLCEVPGANENPISYAKTDIFTTEGSSADSYDMTVNPYHLDSVINLQLGFESNISADSQVITKDVYDNDITVNGERVKLLEYTPYTDPFGTVYKINTTLYPRGTFNNTEEDGNNWPIYDQPTTDNPLMTFERTINKDARETYYLNIQFALTAEKSSVIKVYPGLAKYSALIRKKGNIELGVALLESGYKPTVNEFVLNTRLVEKVDSTVSYIYDGTNEIYGINRTLEIPANKRFEGYVVYEKQSNEMLYAVIEDIAPFASDWTHTADTVWFVPRKYTKDNTRPQ